MCHAVLISKLKALRLDTHTVNWYESYLGNRQQRVNLNGNLSDYKYVEFGVPQGSVLGPVLFTIYINSLANVVRHSKLQMYADDTVIYGTDLVKLKEDLDHVISWCNENILTLNIKKTKWMILTPNVHANYQTGENICINTVPVDRVQTFNYLGLCLDSNLNFQTHIQNITRSIRHKLHFLYKIRNFINVDTTLLIYKTTILPIFDYADFIFDRSIHYITNKLQILQNKALRVVYKSYLHNANHLSTVDLHKRSGLLFLKDRRELHLLYHAYDYKTDLANVDQRPIPTRAHTGIRLIIPKPNLPIFYKSIQYRATLAWNKLNPCFTQISPKQQFKLQLKLFFYQEITRSVQET